MAALLLLVVVPALAYVALSLTGVQRRVADQVEVELSRLLGCQVSVGSLGIVPFNRVSLRNVSVMTAPGDTALTVRRLGAGIRLASLLSDGPVTVNYLEVIGLDARIWRDSASAPLNIQPVIEALRPKDRRKPPALFDLKVNTVLIRSSRMSYDVLSEPWKERFDLSHIRISDLRADVHVPRIKNDDFSVNVKRMGLEERCGFSLSNFVCDVHIDDEGLQIGNLQIDLPDSHLAFRPFYLPTPGFGKLAEGIDSAEFSVEVLPGSRLRAADFAGFVPRLQELDEVVEIKKLRASGSLGGHVSAELDIASGNLFALQAEGEADCLREVSRQVRLDRFQVKASGAEVARVASLFTSVPEKTGKMLARLGLAEISGDAWYDGGTYDASLRLAAAPGAMEILAAGRYDSRRDFTCALTLSTDESLDISVIDPDGVIGVVTGDMEGSIACRRGVYGGHADMEIDRMLLKGALYTGFSAHADIVDNSVTAAARIDNENLAFHVEGGYDRGSNGPSRITVAGELARCVPSALNFTDQYPGAVLRGELDVNLSGLETGHPVGSALLGGWSFQTGDGERLLLRRLALALEPEYIKLRSDYADGELRGDYDFRTVPELVSRVGAVVFPSLMAGDTRPSAHGGAVGRKTHATRKVAEKAPEHVNDFRFHLTLKETENPAGFFRLPVSVIYPAEITGVVSAPSGDLALNIDAPYLRQGNKLVENTRLSLFAGESERSANIDFTTSVPTKDGLMALTIQADGADDRLDSSVRWKIDRERAYEGSLGATTVFSRQAGADTDDAAEPSRLMAVTEIHRSRLTFNDSVWTVNPATVAVSGGCIAVDGLNVYRSGQYVKISGDVGPDPDALLTLDIRNFSLDYLFESLGIDKVMLGGDATGTFYARSLLSGSPVLETPGLAVSRISYNKTVIGDAIVRSRWIPDDKAITLEASIQEPEEKKMSYVDGAIYPLADSLDITFTVNHARVGFMEQYMNAFASGIKGYASGRARLWGNFK
ncbi:MAG: hypothetical protein K2K36_02800, partial [Muribaculaceae bacterium]|nr:hypothetical protein [Muribaculaceae bacterium]